MSSIVQSNPHHRKIELQSPLDLLHLQTQLSTSARQKLDLHFPPTALSSKPATHIALGGSTDPTAPSNTSTTDAAEEENDPLRAHVSRLVTAFLTRTWSAAAPSISINGLDAHTLPQFTRLHSSQKPKPQSSAAEETEGIDFAYTPYDARLQSRLAELYGELEGLTAQVAKLRREAPKKGAEMWEGGLRGEIEGDEEAVATEGMKVDVEEGGNEGAFEREGWDEGRREEVREAYETAVGELGRLARPRVVGSDGCRERELGDLMATSGKLERARRVAEELE